MRDLFFLDWVYMMLVLEVTGFAFANLRLGSEVIVLVVYMLWWGG